MTLFFQTELITNRFVKLCESRGYASSTTLEGPKHIVTVDIPEEDRFNFIAKWAEMTCQVTGPAKGRKRARQRSFDFD